MKLIKSLNPVNPWSVREKCLHYTLNHLKRFHLSCTRKSDAKPKSTVNKDEIPVTHSNTIQLWIQNLAHRKSKPIIYHKVTQTRLTETNNCAKRRNKKKSQRLKHK